MRQLIKDVGFWEVENLYFRLIKAISSKSYETLDIPSFVSARGPRRHLLAEHYMFNQGSDDRSNQSHYGSDPL